MTSLPWWLILIWNSAGTVSAISSLPGTVELLLLTVGGVLPSRRRLPTSDGKHWRLAAIVPAHNEEANIQGSIKSLQNAVSGDFEVAIVVVADNCDDRTAEVAAAAGARVLVRSDLNLRGKGYALDFAFKALRSEGFDAFLIVDADSEVVPNFFLEMGALLRSGADAVQCRYLVKNSAESLRTRLMSVALRAFNVLRPRGRDRLGLSCGINGNGFGMRQATLEAVPYLASSVVEDLEYHISLVRSGKRVRFADETVVYGEMPVAGKGVTTQRARWEGGRFRMIRERSSGLIRDVVQGSRRSIEPLLELLLLPLAFHVTLLIVAALTPWAPARIAGLAGLSVVALHLVAAIAIGGGNWRDAVALLAAPFYVLWKLLLIPALFRGSRTSTTWARTERDHPPRGQNR